MNGKNEMVLNLNARTDLADAAILVIGLIIIGMLLLAIYKAFVKWI
jgi:hypothetical protein